jgi:hypothetical protein
MDQLKTIGLDGCEKCCKAFIPSEVPHECPLMVQGQGTDMQHSDLLRKAIEIRRSQNINYEDFPRFNREEWHTIFKRKVLTYNTVSRNKNIRAGLRFLIYILLEGATDMNKTEEARKLYWKIFFLLPYLLFQIAPPGHTGINKIVAERLRKMLYGEVDELFKEADAISAYYNAPQEGPNGTKLDTHTRKTRRIRSLISRGFLGKAHRLMRSNDKWVDPNTDANVEAAVRTLFPAATEETNTLQCQPSSDAQTPLRKFLTTENVAEALKSKSTGAGPTGMQMDFLVVAGETPEGLEFLTRAMNACLGDVAPHPVNSCLGVGVLTVLAKQPKGYRNIVVREALLRLMSRAIVLREQEAIAKSLAPLQVGVGVKGGAEFMVHTVSRLLELNPTWAMLTLDISNAYGRVSRAAINKKLTDIEDDSADLTKAYFKRFMLKDIEVFTRGQLIFLSQEGLLQGDPLSPLLFSLALQSTLAMAQDTISLGTGSTPDPKSGMVMAYLDDITVVAPLSKIGPVYNQMKTFLASINLTINKEKTQLLEPRMLSQHVVSNARQDLMHELSNMMLDYGFDKSVTSAKLLGVRVGGNHQAVKDGLEADVDQSIFAKLTEYSRTSKQGALLLLRVCMSKMNHYVARNVPKELAQPALFKHDAAVTNTLCGIIDEPFPSVTVYNQFPLPIKNGGMGLPRLVEMSDLAYTAASISTLQTWRKFLPDHNPLLVGWTSEKPPENSPALSGLKTSLAAVHEIFDKANSGVRGRKAITATLPKKMPDLLKFNDVDKLQNRFMLYLNRVNIDLHKRSLGTDEQRAVYNSISAPYASAYLQTVPSESALTLSNEQMLISLRMRLGLPIVKYFECDPEAECACGKTIKDGIVKFTDAHLLNCQETARFKNRHDAMVGVLCQAALSVKLSPVRELPCTRNQMGASQNHAKYDISCPNLDPGVMISHFDATFPSVISSGCMKAGANRPLAVADARVREKHTKYDKYIKDKSANFTPLVIEAQGAVHHEVINFLKKLSYRANHQAPDQAAWTAENFIQYWTQRLSCELHRHNGTGIANAIRAQKAAFSECPLDQPQIQEDGAAPGTEPLVDNGEPIIEHELAVAMSQ